MKTNAAHRQLGWLMAMSTSFRLFIPVPTLGLDNVAERFACQVRSLWTHRLDRSIRAFWADLTCLSVLFLMIGGPAVAQDKYAIVIGVETYDTSTFDNLDYASEDAVELGATLESLGFNTTVMTTESRSANLRPSTPKKIANAIMAVAASCAKGDTLLVSLSGHGVQFSDEELLSSGVRETYFCPSDADITIKTSLLKISQVVEFMNKSVAGRKLLLVDACKEQLLTSNGKRKAAKRIEVKSGSVRLIVES